MAQGPCRAPVAVFGTVPFLTTVLSTMLPMLGLAKHDSMRVVFCCGESAPGQAGLRGQGLVGVRGPSGLRRRAGP